MSCMLKPTLTRPPESATLASLRSAGAQRMDPVRFHYMEVLSGKLQPQPDAVRRVLQDKLDAALASYQECLALAHARPDAAVPVPQTTKVQAATGPGLASLVALNHYLQGLPQASADHASHGTGQVGKNHSQMKSVHQFKKAWSRSRAQDQVALAVQQGPDNAGPLNSHQLVLRSLALMRSLSPDYLQRFLSHTESLLWLDELNLKQTSTERKPARKSRRKV